MRGVGVLAGALVLTWGAPGTPPATAQATPPRTVVVSSMRLGAGDLLTVALHPSAVPIELQVDAGLDLEACPGLLDGGRPTEDNSSWPSWTGFDSCLAFGSDGSLVLPSTVVDTFHLAFLVQGRHAERTRISRLQITYVPGDGYFEVLPPPIGPGARGPRISVTPVSSTTVGARASRISSGPAPTVEVEVRQRGRPVPATHDPPPGGDAPAYGPVRLRAPVHVTATNRGTRAARVRLAIAWT